MAPFPYSLGPNDDWDPQGYNDEEEDTLLPGGMHLEEEDEADKEAEVADVELEDGAVVEEELEVEAVPGEFSDLEKDPIEELNELAENVIETERDSIRYNDFADEEE